MQATVADVLVGLEGTHMSTPVERLLCHLDGIGDDRHRSANELAGAQQSHIVDKYRPVANFRQATIVTLEEMTRIAQALGVPKLYPEDFSANIVLSGVKDFTQLPPEYYLVFSNGRRETHAVLRLMGENRPCEVAGANMKARYPGHKDMGRFVKAAFGKRGQVAVVFAEGVIRQGDTVTFVPHQPEVKKR